MKQANLRRLLCALLTLCLLALAGCGGAGAGEGTVSVPEIAEDGSADQNIWTAYRLGMERMAADGEGYRELGLTYCSDYCFDTALSGAASLQMTVCALLGDTGALACPDWYSAAALTRAAPYPAFFQGLLCEFKGDSVGAQTFYDQAELYEGFPQSLYAFRYLTEASVGELKEIKAACEQIIAQVETAHTNRPYAEELTVLDFMAGYHQMLGDERAAAGDTAAALECYDRALGLNPFETVNYLSCAALALEHRDDRAMDYLSQGLTLDPEDAGLNMLSALLFAAEGETETARHLIDTARLDPAITSEQTAMAEALEREMGGTS